MGALTIGIVAFAALLIGLSFYLMLLLNERKLNQRQVNFLDSVTHELKSPIASLKLYLETLQLRALDAENRRHFYDVMNGELQRLDQLITQLLQVARLDAIGDDAGPEVIPLAPILMECADTVAAHHRCLFESTFEMKLGSVSIKAPRIVLELIFSNLIDNAVKYAGQPPRVSIHVTRLNNHRVAVRIEDNGLGIPRRDRRNIFRLFFRGGDELHRSRREQGSDCLWSTRW